VPEQMKCWQRPERWNRKVMRTLKTILYEAISALALAGISLVYFVDDRLFPIVSILLLGIYVMAAVATEALIVSRFQPSLWRIITANLLVGVIIFTLEWGGVSLTKFSVVAVTTLALRSGAAIISIKAPLITVNRCVAALVGGTLLVEILTTAYGTIERIYYDDFFYPKVKPGYILPTTRWQYCAEQTVFWLCVIGLLYLSHRLLKYAFRHNPEVTV